MNKLLLVSGLSLALAACGDSSRNSSSGGSGSNGGTPPAPAIVADTFNTNPTPANNDLNVIRNDSSLTLKSVPTASALGGTLRVITNGTASTADDLVRYSPPDQSMSPNPATSDSFSYTAIDSAGMEYTTTVTVLLEARPCLNRTLRTANGLGYCFDGFFNTAHDNTKIDFTAYVPHPDALAALGGFSPLVIHSHGFGGSKDADFSIPSHFVDSQAARQVWDKGYFVLSFSQRGFGTSGGQIGLMDPNLEGKDVNEMLDWAIKHFRSDIYTFSFSATNPDHISSTPRATETQTSLLRGDNGMPLPASGGGDPSVGSVGYSYGGGFQYTASHADTDTSIRANAAQRWDALVPEGTWHDLRYSLHSNQTPKTAWLTLLATFAAQGGNGQPLPTFLVQGLAEAFGPTRKVTAPQLQVLKNSSASPYCDPSLGTTTRAAVFHIQGFRDTLFNFNEGYDNAKCFEDAGNDARLLIGIGGHPLPGITQTNYTGNNTSMDIDEVVHCNVGGTPQRLYVREMIVSWFEEKLRGQTNAASIVPKVCIVQENTDPADILVDDNFTDVNTGDANHHKYPKEGVVLNRVNDVLIGAGTSPSYACTMPAGMPHRCTVPATSVTVGPAGAAVFVPLYTVTQAQVMAGIPTVNFTFDRTFAPSDPIVFVATAVQRAGTITPIHEQFQPIRNTDTFPFTAADAATDGSMIHYGCAINSAMLCPRGRLIGIGVRLLPGDVVGLQFSGSQPQYASNNSIAPGMVTITGDVELPIYPPSALPPSLNP